MRRIRPILAAAFLAIPTVSGAQTPKGFADEFLMQFNSSMEKFIALAEAMPAQKYTWSPGEGVMQVGHVYMHVARYNYAYPQNVGTAVPAGVKLDTMESVREKAAVVAALRASADHVRKVVAGLGESGLATPTRLYGRDVPSWSVLLQLLAHMNEHLGQSIAYARSNGIVPPWSQ